MIKFPDFDNCGYVWVYPCSHEIYTLVFRNKGTLCLQLNLKLFKEIMCVHIHPHTQTQNNKSKGANVKW